jgi:hypothetical protein
MSLPPLSNGMIAFLFIAIIIAIVAHWRIHNFWLAVTASSIIATTLFYAIALVKAGPLEPSEALRPLLQCAIIGLIVAIVVGWSAKALRSSISQRA